MDLQKQLMEQKMKVDFNTYDLSIKELIGMVKINKYCPRISKTIPMG